MKMKILMAAVALIVLVGCDSEEMDAEVAKARQDIADRTEAAKEEISERAEQARAELDDRIDAMSGDESEELDNPATDSGAISETVIVEGDGALPHDGDTVYFQYVMTKMDGTEVGKFDHSYAVGSDHGLASSITRPVESVREGGHTKFEVAGSDFQSSYMSDNNLPVDVNYYMDITVTRIERAQ